MERGAGQASVWLSSTGSLSLAVCGLGSGQLIHPLLQAFWRGLWGGILHSRQQGTTQV